MHSDAYFCIMNIRDFAVSIFREYTPSDAENTWDPLKVANDKPKYVTDTKKIIKKMCVHKFISLFHNVNPTKFRLQCFEIEN